MRFLLDSTAYVAWVLGLRFDRAARRRIERSGAAVSAVTVYELDHKAARGKVRLPATVAEGIAEFGFRALDVTARHAARAARLPTLHHDPMDRLLIAQAQMEDMTVVTRDVIFDAYDVAVVTF